MEESEVGNIMKLPHYGNFSLYLYSKSEKDLAKYNIFSIALKSCAKVNNLLKFR